MTTNEETRFAGSPQLGYMSIEQLQEFALRAALSPSPMGSKKTATDLFHTTLRMSRGRQGNVGYYEGPELGIVELCVPDPEGESDRALVNLDTFRHLIESDELTKRREYDGSDYPSRIGAKMLQLGVGYVQDRARFFGVQQG